MRSAFHQCLAQIPGYRCDLVALLSRPLPPPFSPPDQCTPAGAVDDSDTRRNIVQCIFARFPPFPERDWRAEKPVILTTQAAEGFVFSSIGVIMPGTRSHFATHNRKIITSHDKLVTNRVFLLKKHHFHFCPRIFSNNPSQILTFFCLLAKSQTQHETGMYAELMREKYINFEKEWPWLVNKLTQR